MQQREFDQLQQHVASALQEGSQLVHKTVHNVISAVRQHAQLPGGKPARRPARRNPRKQLLLPCGRMAAIIPGDSVAEQVITTGLSQFLNLYNTAIIARLVLTWFPNPPQAIAGPLSTICDPYLNLFRGIIPPLGGTIDLSPLLAFVALDLFSNTASALPCEVPSKDGKSRTRNFIPTPSKVTLAWRRRMINQRRRQQGLPPLDAPTA